MTPLDLIGEEVYPGDSDEVSQIKRRGLEVLSRIDEVSILAMPDIQIQPQPPRPKPVIPICVPDPCYPDAAILRPAPAVEEIEPPPTFTDSQIYQMQMAMIQQCEKRRDRIALIDPPFSVAGKPQLGIAAVQAWRARFDSSYAVLYYPWVKIIDPLFPAGGQTRAIPPSGHVAGQCASTDLRVGVFKAPANELLAWAEDLTVLVNSDTQAILNPLGINAIRALPGRGIRIYGARTLSSDPDWRYLNVRRLLLMIEEAIGIATQWAVFEPNDALTRAKLRLSLTNFLLELWRGGALMGARAEEAFFVRCDESNNPAREREKGNLLAEVGVAPSYPFEFVVLRVGRTQSEIEITEA
jgi:phage tail sheath protein FI